MEKLLPKKKLRNFNDIVKSLKEPTEAQLIEAFIEHRLRDLYLVFIQIIEKGLADDLDFAKENYVTILGELIKSKPEQEEYILSALINKFGDKSKRFINALNKVLGDLIFVIETHDYNELET